MLTKSLNSIHRWPRPLEFKVEQVRILARLTLAHQDQEPHPLAPQAVTHHPGAAVAPPAQALTPKLGLCLNLKQRPLFLSLNRPLKQEPPSLRAHPS